jgi:hypothetical protein
MADEVVRDKMVAILQAEINESIEIRRIPCPTCGCVGRDEPTDSGLALNADINPEYPTDIWCADGESGSGCTSGATLEEIGLHAEAVMLRVAVRAAIE